MGVVAMNSHEELLAEWRRRPRHAGATFVADGAIDPARWGRVKKVLFLLKEAYGEAEDGGDWDLRTAILNEWTGPKYSIWHTAAALSYLCQRAHGTSKPPFPPREENVDVLREALFASAAVNIKKSGGASASVEEDVAVYAREDGDLISRQVQLLAPHIVICGGTWGFTEAIGLKAVQIGRRLWRGGGTYYVEFWHPSYRVPREMMYDALWGIHAETPFL